MEFTETKSGNVIAKSAYIQGAQYIINKGLSYIGKETKVHGERNNGKPVISWGKYVILDDGCEVSPALKDGRYYPLIIGNFVYFGKNSKVMAASVGNNVFVGENAVVSDLAVLRDGAVVGENEVVPPYTVVGPLASYKNKQINEISDGMLDEIERICTLKLNGVYVNLH